MNSLQKLKFLNAEQSRQIKLLAGLARKLLELREGKMANASRGHHGAEEAVGRRMHGRPTVENGNVAYPPEHAQQWRADVASRAATPTSVPQHQQNHPPGSRVRYPHPETGQPTHGRVEEHSADDEVVVRHGRGNAMTFHYVHPDHISSY